MLESANDIEDMLSSPAEEDTTRGPEYNGLARDLFQAIGVIRDILGAVRAGAADRLIEHNSHLSHSA
jgi:hypothetical protein